MSGLLPEWLNVLRLVFILGTFGVLFAWVIMDLLFEYLDIKQIIIKWRLK